MEDQISQSSQVPAKWQERFLLKRIGEEEIELSLEQRNAILTALNAGSRFVQIGKHTLMVNSIKSIDPKWGEENIPPRPRASSTLDAERNMAIRDDSEGEEWDRLFGKKSYKSIGGT